MLHTAFGIFLAASGTVKKVIEINPYLLGTMAGGAADCSFWERNLGIQVSARTFLHDEERRSHSEVPVWYGCVNSANCALNSQARVESCRPS